MKIEEALLSARTISQLDEALEEKQARASALLSLFAKEAETTISEDYAEQLVEALPSLIRFLNEEQMPSFNDVMEQALKSSSENFLKSLEIPPHLGQTWYKKKDGRDVAPEDLVKTARAIALHAGPSETEFEIKTSTIFTNDVERTSLVLEKLQQDRNHFLALIDNVYVSGSDDRRPGLEILNSNAIGTYDWLLNVLRDELEVPENAWRETLQKLDDINVVDRRTIYDPSQPYWKEFPKEKIVWLASAAELELVEGGLTAASNIDRLAMMLQGMVYWDMDTSFSRRMPRLFAPFGALFVYENQMMAGRRNNPDSFYREFLEQIADDYHPGNDLEVGQLFEQQPAGNTNKGYLSSIDRLMTSMHLHSLRTITEQQRLMADLRPTIFRPVINDYITANEALLHHIEDHWGAAARSGNVTKQKDFMFTLGYLGTQGYFNSPYKGVWRIPQKNRQRYSDPIEIARSTHLH